MIQKLEIENSEKKSGLAGLTVSKSNSESPVLLLKFLGRWMEWRSWCAGYTFFFGLLSRTLYRFACMYRKTCISCSCIEKEAKNWNNKSILHARALFRSLAWGRHEILDQCHNESKAYQRVTWQSHDQSHDCQGRMASQSSTWESHVIFVSLHEND